MSLSLFTCGEDGSRSMCDKVVISVGKGKGASSTLIHCPCRRRSTTHCAIALSFLTQLILLHFLRRYEAEALLENKPEGSFLLRDSAQDEFVFSVSFRRYNRSLHARIEESRHEFSFDCHDPGVHRYCWRIVLDVSVISINVSHFEFTP